MKKLFNPNLIFIWEDLMSEKARKLSLSVFLTVLAGAALQIAAPYGLGLMVDALSVKNMNALMVGVIIYFGIEMIGNVIGWVRMRIREHLFQENFWYLPTKLTEKYLARPLSKLTGEDNEIDGGGVESIKDKVWNIISSHIYIIFPNFALALFATVACMWVHPLLGVLALLYIFIDIYVGKKQNSYIHKRMMPIVKDFRKWERRVREWWHATPLIKQNGVEGRIITQVRDEVQPTLKEDDAVWRIFFPWAVLARRTLGQFFAILIYGATGYYAFQGKIEVAACVLLFFSFERIRTVLIEINDQQREIGYQLAAIDVYRKVLQLPTPFDYNKGETFNATAIEISFRNVSLALGKGTEYRPVLKDVNFTIKAGERVGIVGPSGAGKSQLINLVLRGADPKEGAIYISGADLRTLRLESYLRYCGIIPQKSDLFEDTVKGNLVFGVSHEDWQEFLTSPHVEKRIWDALKKAGLDFGDRLSDGLTTKVGYKGMRLSGGQQARMRIADAHFKLGCHLKDRPRLIIADEPTASLDSLSEIAVLEHLTETLPQGTTVLMIAHRLSTVSDMDRIMFVRPLEKVKEGEEQITLHDSLKELYDSDPLFREMAVAQNFVP